MYQRNKLNHAIVTAIAATTGSLPASAAVEEVIVTATKTAASTQDIPVTVQALDNEKIGDLNIGNFDDYVRYLPNVTSGGRGPGQSSVYIRGMATSTISVQLAGANGSAPNVALYLDEQPVTLVGRNLDVYAADLERIEVLPGPQGTLFGASSQAGTVRLITRKPVMNEFDTGFKAGFAATDGGGPSNNVEGYLNLPLIDDKLAVRLVAYNVREGGYIDNVPGEKKISPDNSAFGGSAPPAANRDSAFNTALVENDFNDSYYQGFRVGANYWINDDWQFLLQLSNQELGADGVFDYDPDIGDLQVQRYFPDELTDDFTQLAWTLEGRVGALDLIYTGAYLDRDVEQSIDYTGYSDEGPFIPYYICEYPGYAECSSPELGVRVNSTFTRQTHELRVATPQDKRLRAIGGVFFEDVELEEVGDFIYPGSLDRGFVQGRVPLTDSTVADGSPRLPGTVFFNDITRTEEQIALFGEVTYDLIPEVLALTGGLRWYDLEVDLRGSSNFGSRSSTQVGVNLDTNLAPFAPLQEDDVIPKVTLTWTPNADQLYYATYSEGFRPGGFNRGGGRIGTAPNAQVTPFTYATDEITNYELGWKTTLLQGELQWNGAVYFVEWDDMQVARFDPLVFGNLTFIDNAADSELFGVEMDVIYQPTDALSVFGALSYNDTELTAVPDAGSGTIETAPVGSQLALAPEWQANARARYTWFLNQYDVYAQGGVQYVDDSFNSIVAAERRQQDSYTTADAALGVTKDEWKVEMFVENLTDERAELFINTQDKDERIFTNRPRTIGIRFSYDY